jgi:hypothetical protein
VPGVEQLLHQQRIPTRALPPFTAIAVGHHH